MLLFSTLVFSSVIAYNMRNLAMFPKEQGSDQGQLGSLKVIEVFNGFKTKVKNLLWGHFWWKWSSFDLIPDNEINVGPKSIIPTSTPPGIHRPSGQVDWYKNWTVLVCGFLMYAFLGDRNAEQWTTCDLLEAIFARKSCWLSWWRSR